MTLLASLWAALVHWFQPVSDWWWLVLAMAALGAIDRWRRPRK